MKLERAIFIMLVYTFDTLAIKTEGVCLELSKVGRKQEGGGDQHKKPEKSFTSIKSRKEISWLHHPHAFYNIPITGTLILACNCS